MARRPRVLRCKRLPRNERGRDLVVGDLHGHRALLERALERLRFDPARDRVLSVGDLVDRGPDSLATLSLIAEPWFHAVLGNHEMLLLHALQVLHGHADEHGAAQAWLAGAGAWLPEAIARHPKRVERLRPLLAALPLALQVEHALPFHVMHADLDPAGPPWPAPGATVTVREAGRLTRSRANLAGLDGAALASLPFGGHAVRLSETPLGALPITYVGHSPLPEVTVHRSHVYIDQGVAAPTAKRPAARPPTVIDHGAFGYWLTGVAAARGRAEPLMRCAGPASERRAA